MYIESIKLWEETPGMCEEIPVLDVFVPEKKTSKTAVVIFPGGGYSSRAPHEGKEYAEFLNENGITAFVCQYRVSPHQFPLPLLDARRSVRLVRHFKDKYDINQVYVMGSSAGGHLAALVSTYNDKIDFEGIDEIDNENFKPDGQILCYPVISLCIDDVSHIRSGDRFLEERHAEMGAKVSPNLIADETAPKAFIWHTYEDPGVNVINSIDYAKKLKTVNVLTELHIYPYGRHGKGLATDLEHTRNWTFELLEWIKLHEK